MPTSNQNNDNGKRIRLRVMGISYSQIQSGAYALILAQTDGPYRIPVVVGAPEAQAIAIKMEGIIPPRPMTHDLFASMAHGFGIELKEVFIHKFEDGIFSSELTLIDSYGTEVILDARTSDAIAIAMRTQAPIYTTPEILEETGFIMEIKEEHAAATDPDTATSTEDSLQSKSDSELNKMMQEHIKNEEYELAARIKAILTERSNRQPPSL